MPGIIRDLFWGDRANRTYDSASSVTKPKAQKPQRRNNRPEKTPAPGELEYISPLTHPGVQMAVDSADRLAGASASVGHQQTQAEAEAELRRRYERGLAPRTGLQGPHGSSLTRQYAESEPQGGLQYWGPDKPFENTTFGGFPTFTPPATYASAETTPEPEPTSLPTQRSLMSVSPYAAIPQVKTALDDWMNAQKSRVDVIPAGQDVYGGERVKAVIGNPDYVRHANDPGTLEEHYPSGEGWTITKDETGQPWAERMENGQLVRYKVSDENDWDQNNLITRMTGGLIGTPYDDIPRIDKSELSDPGTLARRFWDEQVVGPLFQTAEAVNDVNTRVMNARRNIFNDPNKTEDDPTTLYHTATGEPFTVKDRLTYYRLRDGTIVEQSDYEAAINNPVAYRLPDGRTVAVSDFDAPEGADWEILRPGDPRMSDAQQASDGNYYYANSLVLKNGMTIRRDDLDHLTIASFALPDGREFDYDAIPQSDQEWKDAFYQYRAPDRQTVIANADGTIPDELVGKLFMEERGSDYAPTDPIGRIADALNLEVSNPRAPWQDEAGNNIWDVGAYDVRHSAIDEALPWFIDANLSSTPYYIPGYNLISGASRVLPYMAGMDGSSYRPVGDLTQVGQGDYADNRLTQGQALGGGLASIVDAVAERIGGRSIGSTKPWFGPGIASHLASSGIREGLEEIAAQPWQQLEEEGWENLGRPKYWNEQKQDWEFDQTAPRGWLTWPSISGDLGAFASGVAIGLPIEAAEMVGSGSLSAMRHGGFNPYPEIPAATPANLGDIQPGDSSLDRRYENEEW